MNCQLRSVVRELDLEKLNRRFPGLGLNVPCGVNDGGGGGEDGDSGPTSVCHVFDNLPQWNYVLWHVGLQLRELRVPGRLRLVHVFYRGGGGRPHRARSHLARILFRILLVQHNCVEGLHLDHSLIEGSGLGEYREFIVSALQKNEHPRGTVRSRRRHGEPWRAGRVLQCRDPSVLVDVVCTLLVATTRLTTLTMPRLILDDASGARLVTALRRNKTIEKLSLHGSVLHSYVPSGMARFSYFLASSTQLTSLSVDGVDMRPESTLKYIKSIILPLCIRSNLQKLRLSGFLLSAQCACLFAALVTASNGCLQSLDIRDCPWRLKSPVELPRDAEAIDGEQSGHPGLEPNSCRWVQVFDRTKPVQLSFLALSIQGLEPEHLRPLLNTAIDIEPLKTLSLSRVSQEKLKAVCRLIKETAMSGRVRIEGVHVVDSSALTDLREYPEALSKVVIRSFAERTPRVFSIAVRLACSLYLVTVLDLHLTQNTLLDIPALRALCNCLSTADSLRELSLRGCGQPDLTSTFDSEEQPFSVLLEAIFKNSAIRALQLNGLGLGDQNLAFCVSGVAASESLCEFAFASWNWAENDMFLRLLAFTFTVNDTITCVRLPTSTGCLGDEWFYIESTIGLNTGMLTRAVHFVMGKDSSPRCEASFVVLSGTNALTKKTEELTEDTASTDNI
ncbi:hypothetical protein HPB51_020514 [Rhipicephalus microplus]|uniref:Uncharacterized protein n=1 Tax=Rhipicephalus microplus TaxID=6941 RepID=A0A9J6EUM4_RHIMP|nr:hypothetical protein HPB51_020514 [Rhipicephalus microplus]